MAVCTHIHHLSVARYSFIQLSGLEQCRVKKLAQGFNSAAQDSNPGPLSRDSDAILLSHGAHEINAKTLSIHMDMWGCR